MATKKDQADSTAGHINAINSQLHALEVQVTLLRGVLSEKSAAAKPVKGKTVKDEEEEFDLDQGEDLVDEDEDEDDEDEDEDEDDEDDEAPTLDQVLKSVQKFSAKSVRNKAACQKILKKYKINSVRELKPQFFQAVLDELEGA